MPKNIKDPAYSTLVEEFIASYEVDYIFEEASGQGPTIASKIAKIRGVRYKDVDPSPEKRGKHGLAAITGRPYLVCALGRAAAPEQGEVVEEYFNPQADREILWVEEITKKSFALGLVICGLLHTLSLASRLDAEGIKVNALTYLPNMDRMESLRKTL